MTITGALVLYAVLWVLGMLIALPLGLQTQGDTGHQADDTPASTPLNPNLGRKALRVTLRGRRHLGGDLCHNLVRPGNHVRHRLLEPHVKHRARGARILSAPGHPSVLSRVTLLRLMAILSRIGFTSNAQPGSACIDIHTAFRQMCGFSHNKAPYVTINYLNYGQNVAKFTKLNAYLTLSNIQICDFFASIMAKISLTMRRIVVLLGQCSPNVAPVGATVTSEWEKVR